MKLTILLVVLFALLAIGHGFPEAAIKEKQLAAHIVEATHDDLAKLLKNDENSEVMNAEDDEEDDDAAENEAHNDEDEDDDEDGDDDQLSENVVAVGANKDKLAALVPANLSELEATGINPKHLVGYVPVTSRSGAPVILPPGAVQIVSEEELIEELEKQEEEERRMRRRRRRPSRRRNPARRKRRNRNRRRRNNRRRKNRRRNIRRRNNRIRQNRRRRNQTQRKRRPVQG